MRLERVDSTTVKGWYLGPWNADLGIAIGFAHAGIDAPHAHRRMNEVYLVARGWAEVRIEMRSMTLTAGDVLLIEPGDAHTFLASSSDYMHFVLHVPALPAEEARADRVDVPRSRLGLEPGPATLA